MSSKSCILMVLPFICDKRPSMNCKTKSVLWQGKFLLSLYRKGLTHITKSSITHIHNHVHTYGLRGYCDVITSTGFTRNVGITLKPYPPGHCQFRISFRHNNAPCTLYTRCVHGSTSKLYSVTKMSKSTNPTSLTKRQKKKKMKKKTEGDMKKITAFATAEEYDLEGISRMLQLQGKYLISKLPEDLDDVIHVKPLNPVAEHLSEIFFFQQGSVVFWDMPPDERYEFFKLVRQLGIGRYETELIMDEEENVEFKVVENEKANFVGGIIHVRDQLSEEQDMLEKYTFSHAISQSVKLAVWETQLDSFVDSIEHILDDLKHRSRVGITSEDTVKKLGNLFEFRLNINLRSDLLDTPDFYWDREELESLYSKLFQFLNISKRTKVMNERLNNCIDLMELIKSKKSDEKHVRLEWIIIILIMIEVFFEIRYFIERYYTNNEEVRRRRHDEVKPKCKDAEDE